MVYMAKFDCFALNSSCPRDAMARVKREGSNDVRHLSQDACERASILDGLCGALRKERDHWMSRVANERDAPKRK